MNEELKKEFYNFLIEGIKKGKINNFIIFEKENLKNEYNENTEGKLFVDYQNISNFNLIKLLNAPKILISKKNAKLIKKLSPKKELIDFMEEHCFEKSLKTDYETKLSNGLNYKYNITRHSQIQFIKRMLLFYLKYTEETNKEYDKNLNLFIQEYDKNKNNKNYFDEPNIIKKLISKYIDSGNNFNKQKVLYRKRDIKHFEEREKKHSSTTRIIFHPFVFVFTENVLVTSELYSSSFDVSNPNKLARDSEITISELVRKIKTKQQNISNNINYQEIESLGI
jgi:hypothetical protein